MLGGVGGVRRNPAPIPIDLLSGSSVGSSDGEHRLGTQVCFSKQFRPTAREARLLPSQNRFGQQS